MGIQSTMNRHKCVSCMCAFLSISYQDRCLRSVLADAMMMMAFATLLSSAQAHLRNREL